MNRKPDMNNSKGFTLVEILLYISILTILIAATMSFIFLVMFNNAKYKATIEVNDQADIVLSKITQSIREASDITIPEYRNESTELIILSHDTSINPIHYFVESGTLYLQQGTNQQTALTNSKIEVIEFRLEDKTRGNQNRSITISLTIKHRNPDNLGSFNYEKTFVITENARS